MKPNEFIIKLDSDVKSIIGQIKRLEISDNLAWETIKSNGKMLDTLSERIDILVKRIDRLEAE